MFFAGSLGFLGALEIELIGGVNNFSFHPQSRMEHSDVRKFQAYPYGLLNLSFRGDLSNALAFDISVDRENVLQNTITGTLITRTDNFRFEFGLFAGISDNFDIPDAGITGIIELTLPGIGYLSFSGSSTLGSSFDFTSKNHRETAGIEIGYWYSENFILSASAEIKSFSRYIGQYLTIRDQFIRYQFSIEYFKKNSPFTVRVDTGYETLSRTYLRGAMVNIDELSALFAGVEFNWQITHPIRIKAGIELPVFTIPAAPLAVDAGFLGFFKAYTGLTYSFF